MKTFHMTVDVERDWRTQETFGITEGIPKLLKLFDKYKVKATFFVLAELLDEFKEDIIKIKEKGHEIATHSFYHSHISNYDVVQLTALLKWIKTKFKENKIDIKGFRAPCLITPKYLQSSLKLADYAYDSSKTNFWFPTRYNYIGTPNKPHLTKEGVKEIPISNLPGFPPWPLALSMLKTGWEKKREKLKQMDQDTITMYLHPYEIINWRPKKLPWALKKFAKITGDEALKIVEEIIIMFKKKGYQFKRCEDTCC